MPIQRYSVNQHPVDILLAWIKAGEIAIPDIQRPFVWNAAKVRDFIDSLYNGYPVGYLIAWQNPNIRLKDGTQAAGKKILIDGQQRVTALLAVLLGQQIINKDYKRTRISIAFHPVEEKFEVTNPAIRKDREWVADIATAFASETKTFVLVRKYCEANPGVDEDDIFERINRLQSIRNNPIGLIDLNSDLDIETVAEIFVRINSKGVSLNAADFAMSKMAASEKHDGHHLRKCIDYFCHLAIAPEAYNDLIKDEEFVNMDYFRAMEWLKNGKEDLYDPSYNDMLRVAFTQEFKRGRLEDLVALLSGRNFETRTFEETIAENSFGRLKKAVPLYMNETNFKRFIMILRSAGFVSASMIRSQNTVNFAYLLYLTLRKQHVDSSQIETLVRRWFVMSILTSRYTSSPETAFGVDVRRPEISPPPPVKGSLNPAVGTLASVALRVSFVEVSYVALRIKIPVQRHQLRGLLLWSPPGGYLPQAAVQKPFGAFVSVTDYVTTKCPLRYTELLCRLFLCHLLVLPSVVNSLELIHPDSLQKPCLIHQYLLL